MVSSYEHMPVKMKGFSIDQVDKILSSIDSNSLIAVALLPHLAEKHIATTLVLEMLAEVEDIALEWLSIDTVSSNFIQTPWFCMNSNGDSFLLLKKVNEKYLLEMEASSGEGTDSFWVNYEEMTQGLGISPKALVITKNQTPSALAQPFSPPPSKEIGRAHV